MPDKKIETPLTASELCCVISLQAKRISDFADKNQFTLAADPKAVSRLEDMVGDLLATVDVLGNVSA